MDKIKHSKNLFSPSENTKKTVYIKANAVKLDAKCLYASKLEKISHWHEKPHSHPFCEIMFVLSGNGIITISDKEYAVQKGDIVIYNPYTVHKESTCGNNSIELAFFGISGFQLGNLPGDHISGEKNTPVIHSGKEEEKFREQFLSLVKEVYENEQYGAVMAKYIARIILISIIRLAEIPEEKLVPNAAFTRIHQYLTTNFAHIESMDQVCEELNINRYYLSHVFKKYMGIPPMQYVTAKKIEYAKKLLCDTNLTASAIGEVCGYKDRVLFFKAFKKLEGTTPAAYRKDTGRKTKK